jgi:environmental stress-induced protein Ves
MSFSRWDLATLPESPWPNGAGTLKVLASEPEGADLAALHWRVSVATVSQDSTFSALPGFDRCIALLTGQGMQLTSAATASVHWLGERLAPFHFPGETVFEACLPHGPVENLSVLVRRGAGGARVVALQGRSDHPVVGGGSVLFLCCSGRFRVHASGEVAAEMVTAGQGLRWHADEVDVRVCASEDAASGLLVHLG